MRSFRYSLTAFGISFGSLIGLATYDVKGGIIGLCVGLAFGYPLDMIVHLIEQKSRAKRYAQRQQELKKQQAEKQARRAAAVHKAKVNSIKRLGEQSKAMNSL